MSVSDIAADMYLGMSLHNSGYSRAITSRFNYKSSKNAHEMELKQKGKARAFNLHVAVMPTLIMAAVCGFFPVKGITSKTSSDLRFTYWNWRSFYSYTVLSGALFMGMISVYRICKDGLDIATSGDSMFFMGNAVGMFLFIHLAASWSELMTEWNEVEIILPPIKRRTKLKIRITTYLITFLSLFEHLSADAYHVTRFFKEEPLSWQIMNLYLQNAYWMMFSVLPYHVFLGVIFAIIHLINVIVWNYVDLIIIIHSIALTDLFYSLDSMVDHAEGKLLDKEDWRLLREMYNKLYSLTNLVDDKLSFLVLFSVGSNVYFICIQLLNSLRKLESLSQGMYFYSSFAYLLGRTLAVCLTAASVPIAARLPLKSLFSAPSHSYNVEIQRLITQITSDEIGLTGYKFFKVTRSLIISVLATIITYEIVLSSMQPN